MSNPTTLRRLLCLLLPAFASLPALATQTTIPGMMCMSESSSVDRPTSGALINTNAVSGTTKFRCPIIRTWPVGGIPVTMTVYIFAKTNYNSAQFGCTLRSVDSMGETYHSADVIFPADNTYRWSGVNVILPPNTSASVHLRCNVPNVYASSQAGILALRIDD